MLPFKKGESLYLLLYMHIFTSADVMEHSLVVLILVSVKKTMCTQSMHTEPASRQTSLKLFELLCSSYRQALIPLVM